MGLHESTTANHSAKLLIGGDTSMLGASFAGASPDSIKSQSDTSQLKKAVELCQDLKENLRTRVNMARDGILDETLDSVIRDCEGPYKLLGGMVDGINLVYNWMMQRHLQERHLTRLRTFVTELPERTDQIFACGFQISDEDKRSLGEVQEIVQDILQRRPLPNQNPPSPAL